MAINENDKCGWNGSGISDCKKQNCICKAIMEGTYEENYQILMGLYGHIDYTRVTTIDPFREKTL